MTPTKALSVTALVRVVVQASRTRAFQADPRQIPHTFNRQADTRSSEKTASANQINTLLSLENDIQGYRGFIDA
jgi:hypothetical protein